MCVRAWGGGRGGGRGNFGERKYINLHGKADNPFPRLDFLYDLDCRFDDTDLLFREYSENIPETERSQKAVQRINAIHGMYAKQISNGDMLYSLSLFVTEPARWIDRYQTAEKCAPIGIFMSRLVALRGLERGRFPSR